MKDGADADFIKSVLDVRACPVGHCGEVAQRASALPAAPPQVRCREAAASEEGARRSVHPHHSHSLHQCPWHVFRFHRPLCHVSRFGQGSGFRYIACAMATPKATPPSSQRHKLDVLPARPSRFPGLQQDRLLPRPIPIPEPTPIPIPVGVQTPRCSSSQAV